MKKLMGLLWLVAVLWSCGENEETKQLRTKAEQQRLAAEYKAAFKVAVLPTMDCLPLYLLKDSLLYDTAKVDIRLRRFSAQMDCDTALTGGSVQGAVSDLVRTERLKRKGTPLKYAAATNAYWLLLTNKRARLKEPKQLSDKMVAMTRFSATDLLTDLVVGRAKPKYPVFRIQINDVALRLHMLQNNEMDAMWLTEPYATVAKEAGHPVMADSRKDSLQLGVLAFRVKDIAEDRRYNQMQELLKAYDRACDLINKNGVAHYSDLIQKYMGVDKQTVKALPKMVFERSREPLRRDIAKAEAFAR